MHRGSVLLSLITVVTLLIAAPVPAIGYRPWFHLKPNRSNLRFGSSKNYESSSELVHLRYHMGPVLTSSITVHTIWCGRWQKSQKKIIREFFGLISPSMPSNLRLLVVADNEPYEKNYLSARMAYVDTKCNTTSDVVSEKSVE